MAAERAPWNAGNWKPPHRPTPQQVAARHAIIMGKQAAYDAGRSRFAASLSATTAGLPLAAAEADAALRSRAADLAGLSSTSTVGALLEAHAQSQTRKAASRYAVWEANVATPLSSSICDAVVANADTIRGLRRSQYNAYLADGGGDSGGGGGGGFRGMTVPTAASISVSDPCKVALLRDAAERALLRGNAGGSTGLPPARTRELLPAPSWAAQAISATPHGHFAVNCRRAQGRYFRAEAAEPRRLGMADYDGRDAGASVRSARGAESGGGRCGQDGERGKRQFAGVTSSAAIASEQRGGKGTGKRQFVGVKGRTDGLVA